VVQALAHALAVVARPQGRHHLVHRQGVARCGGQQLEQALGGGTRPIVQDLAIAPQLEAA